MKMYLHHDNKIIPFFCNQLVSVIKKADVTTRKSTFQRGQSEINESKWEGKKTINHERTI